MTGRLARIMVGTCMTAALTVSGLLGSVPAAHAGGGASCTSVSVGNLITVNCVGVNNNNIPVTVNVTGNEINVVKVQNIVIGDIASNNDIDINHVLDNISVNVLNDLHAANITCSIVEVKVLSLQKNNVCS